MSGETNELIELAKSIDKDANGREYDVLISTGEQVTISLLAMTLIKKGIVYFINRSTSWNYH